MQPTWLAVTSNRIVVPRPARLGTIPGLLKGLQIRALVVENKIEEEGGKIG